MGLYIAQQEVMKRLGNPDHKTLRRWCEETKVTPRKRKGHGNVLWYTGTQLRTLQRTARSRGREVVEDRTTDSESALAEMVQEEVRRQVAALRQELFAFLQGTSPEHQSDNEQ